MQRGSGKRREELEQVWARARRKTRRQGSGRPRTPAPTQAVRQVLEQEPHIPSTVPSTVRQPRSCKRFPLGSTVFAARLSLHRLLNKYCDRPAPCPQGQQGTQLSLRAPVMGAPCITAGFSFQCKGEVLCLNKPGSGPWLSHTHRAHWGGGEGKAKAAPNVGFAHTGRKEAALPSPSCSHRASTYHPTSI